MYKEAKHWAYSEKEEVAFVHLDFAKAFDRLEWRFLDAMLHAQGFGDDFCSWVKIL